MKQLVVAYFDKKLNYFLPISSIPECTDDDLIESSKRLVCSDQCPMRFLEYDLYRLGTYEDKTGKLEIHSPEFIVSLGDFRSIKEECKNVQS